MNKQLEALVVSRVDGGLTVSVDGNVILRATERDGDYNVFADGNLLIATITSGNYDMTLRTSKIDGYEFSDEVILGAAELQGFLAEEQEEDPQPRPEMHDDVGLFWVVSIPSGVSELGDILFQTTVLGLSKCIEGGLRESQIAGLFTDEAQAAKRANDLLVERDRFMGFATDE